MFLPAEVISEPCVLFDPAAFRFRPFRPKTPWLLEVNWPAEFGPQTAPREVAPRVEVAEPAALTVEHAAAPTVPAAFPPTFAAVLVTAPTEPLAVEATPPTSPPPPEERAPPEPLALPMPEPARSGAASELDAMVSAAASA